MVGLGTRPPTAAVEMGPTAVGLVDGDEVAAVPVVVSLCIGTAGGLVVLRLIESTARCRGENELEIGGGTSGLPETADCALDTTVVPCLESKRSSRRGVGLFVLPASAVAVAAAHIAAAGLSVWVLVPSAAL